MSPSRAQSFDTQLRCELFRLHKRNSEKSIKADVPGALVRPWNYQNDSGRLRKSVREEQPI